MPREPSAKTTHAGGRAIIELAHALVVDAAEQVDVRFVILKGLAAEAAGLREPRTPADVDVLTSPNDALALGDELVARGWRLRPADADDITFPRHAATYFHPSWSCDVDVHYRFPGMDSDSAAVFEYLWSTRTSFRAGGVDVWAPARAATAIVMALHCLRNMGVVGRQADYADLVQRTACGLEAQTVVQVAKELGALPYLHSFIYESFGLEVPGELEVSLEWRLRTSLPSPLARRLEIFLRASWATRVRLLRLALAPSAATLFKDGSGDVSSSLG